MIEFKLVLNKDEWTLHSPTGSYRSCKSFQEIPQMIADSMRDYSRTLKIYADSIPSKDPEPVES